MKESPFKNFVEEYWETISPQTCFIQGKFCQIPLVHTAFGTEVTEQLYSVTMTFQHYWTCQQTHVSLLENVSAHNSDKEWIGSAHLTAPLSIPANQLYSRFCLTVGEGEKKSKKRDGQVRREGGTVWGCRMSIFCWSLEIQTADL